MKPFTKVINPGTVNVYGDRYTNLFIEIRYKPDGELSIVGVEGPLANGNAVGGCGQIDQKYTRQFIETSMNLEKAWSVDLLVKVIEVWDRWHLSHMKAGTPAQDAYLREHRVKVTYPQSQYEQDKQTLRDAGLEPDPDTGYVYGTAWLREDVPSEVLEFIKNLPDTTRSPAWV